MAKKRRLQGKVRISLTMAAREFGYRSTSTLRRAAERGALNAEKNLTGDWETTREEVLAYLGQHSENYHRGEEKPRRPAGEEQP